MNEVIVLIGAPGSGKSTWGEKYAKDHGYTYLSSDRNRARLGTGEEDQSVSYRAFKLLETELDEALFDNKNVIVDACFMSRKSRSKFVKTARNHDCHVKAVVFELDKQTILERNEIRFKNGGRKVPTVAINTMLSRYQKPESPEFDEVEIISK